jgi:hypothetical protein
MRSLLKLDSVEILSEMNLCLTVISSVLRVLLPKAHYLN